MAVINSVNNGTLTNYGTISSEFVPQAQVTFDFDVVFLDDTTSAIIQFGGSANNEYSSIFVLNAIPFDSGANLDIHISVDLQNPIAPTTGSNSFTLTGNTLTLSGTISVNSIDPVSGSITLTTANGSVAWDNLGSPVFLDNGTYNQIEGWDIYCNSPSANFTSTLVTVDMTLDGSSLHYFTATAYPPNFGSSNFSTVFLGGVSFENPTETGINYTLDGGPTLSAADFSLTDNTSSQVNQAVVGGAWSAVGPTIANDNMTHVINLYSTSNSSDSTSATFYSGGLFLSLNDLSGVTVGEFPTISGFEGNGIDSVPYYLLDGTVTGDVADYVPATVSGGPWSGIGPSAGAGVHTLYVGWVDTSGGDGSASGGDTGGGADAMVQSNTITYTIEGGGAYLPINIMII